MDQITEKQKVDEQRKEQLIKDIDYIKQLMDQEYEQKLNDDKERIYNIFLLGPSGSGKSTIANELNDVKIVFQTEDDESFLCSKQQNEHMKFQVAQDTMMSQTDKPQAEKNNNQYQVWDLPGYFDNRSSEKDLKNIVFSQSLIQESQYSQIVVVFSVHEFFEKQLSRLIQILNNIHTDQEISISLIITMVNGQKLKVFQDKLNKLLQTNILQEGKKLLQQILQQNRVILFEVPEQNPENEEFYEFNQQSIQKIKNQLFNPDLFISHKNVQLKPPDETKNTLSEIYNYYLTSIRQSIEKLTKQLLSFFIKFIISVQLEELEELKQLQSEYEAKYKQLQFFCQTIFIRFQKRIRLWGTKKAKTQRNRNIFKQFDDINLKDDYQHVYQEKDILYIYCIHLSAQQLKTFLKKFKGVQTIFICCFLSFKLDRNLILPGITLHIKTRYFIVEELENYNYTKIILKGQDGIPFDPPKAGQSKINPQDGEEGEVGYNGINGGNLFIEAKTFKNLQLLIVDVRGGNGGQGQEGGDGQNGQDGQDGEIINDPNNKEKIVQTHEIEQTALEDIGTFHHTYILTYQSRGTAGEIGGNAGSGGQGGHGGIAGQFKIDTDFQIKVKNSDGQFGPNGENGIPGRGGQTGRTFTRRFKLKKALGALRQHENLVQSQSIKARVGANIASLGVFTVASVVGSIVTEALKALQNSDQWLDDGEYQVEDMFAESGQIKEPKKQRDAQKVQSLLDLKKQEMQQFAVQTQEKWNKNKWIKAIIEIY